jgi:hypothetical protein
VARAPRANIQHRLAPIRTARHDHGFDQECQEKTATGQYESQRIVQSWRERTKLVSTAAQKVYKAGRSSPAPSPGKQDADSAANKYKRRKELFSFRPDPCRLLSPQTWRDRLPGFLKTYAPFKAIVLSHTTNATSDIFHSPLNTLDAFLRTLPTRSEMLFFAVAKCTGAAEAPIEPVCRHQEAASTDRNRGLAERGQDSLTEKRGTRNEGHAGCK